MSLCVFFNVWQVFKAVLDMWNNWQKVSSGKKMQIMIWNWIEKNDSEHTFKKKKTFLSKIRGFVILRLFSCKFSYLKFSFSEKATKIWEKSSTCNAATEKWDIVFKFYGLLTMSELKKLPMIYIDTRNFGIVFTSILMQESKISTEIRSGKK